MLVALTRDEAEERHRTRQSYSLATRLPGGNLLVLHHHTNWTPHDVDPRGNPHYLQKRDFLLRVFGSMGRLKSHFAENREGCGVIKMRNANIYAYTGARTHFSAPPLKEVWEAHNDFADGTKAIYDYRAGLCDTSRPMTDSDLALCEFAEPPFGEFGDFWRRVSTYLENEGFGSFT